MKINLDYLKNKYGKKAKVYTDDKDKTTDLINKAMLKANVLESSSPLVELLDDLRLLFMMVKDWANGSYKPLPTSSITYIIIGIIYFVSPIDLIADFLPLGFIDDAFVIALVMKQIKIDIEKYKIWKDLSNDLKKI